MPLIPEFRRQKQADFGVQGQPGLQVYRVSSRTARAIQEKKKKKKKKKKGVGGRNHMFGPGA
jgi:hypothetical protein